MLSPSSLPQSPARRLGLMVASVAIFFGLLELGLRLGGFSHLPARIPPIVWNAEEDKAMRNGESLFEEDVLQLWRPRPGAVTPWGNDEHINPSGYRGPELTLERKPGVLRIATLGDSSTFGMRVDVDATWTARLARFLADRGTPCEALNAGVIGFTIEQGIERYRALVRQYHPDLVIAAFGAVNEHFPAIDLPDREKIAARASVGWARELADAARYNVRCLHLVGWIVDKARGEDRVAMRKALMRKRAEQTKLNEEMGRLDWPGKRRVEVARFRECIRELDAMVRADGGKLILMSMPRFPDKETEEPVMVAYNEAVLATAAELGVPCFDVRETVRAQLAAGVRWKRLFVDYYHPSVEGHALIAAGLLPVVSSSLPAQQAAALPPAATR